MNWDRIEGNWKQFKGKVKEQWGKLTDDDIDVIAGKRDQLVGKIQEQYGITQGRSRKAGRPFRRRASATMTCANTSKEDHPMKLSQLMMALVAASGLCVAGGGAGADDEQGSARSWPTRTPTSQYKTDKAACDGLSGNAKDICIEEAKGKEKVAKADADAAYENTPKARESARDARADAAYEVAKEKCDDLAGNAKDVCVKEAKAAHAKAKADAKVDRVASDTRSDAVGKDRRSAARSHRREARRRLQGRDREMRRAERRAEGRLRA